MTQRLTPASVGGGKFWSHLSTGYRHTCGVTKAGRGFCWGDNFFGQIGNGTTTDALLPVLVGDGLHMSQVSAAHVHSCAITPEAKAYCWGENSIGQLGVIPRGQYPSPVQVMDPADM
jgi:alpha-tubulin suppressor-like RCC1 family protein